MPKQEGNAHGRHYTEDEHDADEERNHNQSQGRQHFEQSEHEKAGGHSDRWATGSAGEQHEFASDKGDDNLDVHNNPQDEGQLQGEARNEGGHQGGRNRKNSRYSLLFPLALYAPVLPARHALPGARTPQARFGPTVHRVLL